jgi:hypothetical protein
VVELSPGDRRQGLSRTVIITQSNYLPWRGYFDLLRLADEVVLLDSVQYTRRDWRNRNKIKTASGPVWLTVPVEAKGLYHQAIDETRVSDTAWVESHLRAIDLAYRRAPRHADVFPWLETLLTSVKGEPMLSRINETLLRGICGRLGLNMPIRRCTDLLDREAMRGMEPTERLVQIAIAAGATCYVSGPAAKAYLDPTAFAAYGITVEWMSYAGYSDYPQLWGAFEPQVSIVDLLLNTGPDAVGYLDRAVTA